MSERENQLPTSTTGDDDHHETPSSSKFFQRVSNISLVDQAITTTTNSYQRVKGASPSLIQPAIESAEQTTIKLLERIISTIQALPLPLAYADNVACGGLDKLEQLTEYKECLLARLRLIKSEKDSLGKDSDFYERLLTFANETKDLAVVEVRSTLQAFVDTQLRLLERIEDVVDSFYRTQKQRLSKTGNEDMSDVKLSTDLVQHLNHVKQVVEDVMQQRNILCWFRIGSANPLEPVWRHLHASAQALTPEIATMKNFSDKISFLKVILHSVVEQIKLAAKNPRSTFEEIKNNLVDEITGVAVAWLPEFALRGITRITGFPLLDRTVAQIEAPLVEESCQAQCSSDGMKNKADEVEEEKEEEEKTSRPIITVSEETDPEIKGPRKTEPVSLSESSIGFLEVVQEVPAEENDDSSDQHSQSGLENSTEIDVNNGDEGKKLSRSTRRRRKKFAKNHENASH